MEQEEYWKDFIALISSRPGYKGYRHCEDPEEAALRSELLGLLLRFNLRYEEAKKLPMPAEMTEVHLTRASLHIDQRIAFYDFLETLFENFLQDKEHENMRLLFSFLDFYTRLLECELQYAQ